MGASQFGGDVMLGSGSSCVLAAGVTRARYDRFLGAESMVLVRWQPNGERYFALDRLSRYEATLWRQAGQILFALDALDRRKPQERAPFSYR
jgi:hypothetical protein